MLSGSPLQQSPTEALRSKYFFVNLVISIVINWGLNTGIAYGVLNSNDYVGLWSSPSSPNAAPTAMALDLAITGFLIVLLSSLVVTSVVKNAVGKAEVIPIPDEALSRGWLRFTPCRVENSWARGTLLALLYMVLFLVPTLVVLSLLCSSGSLSLPLNSSQCGMAVSPYYWFKGLWAGAQAAVAYPLILLGAVNKARIPEYLYDEFVVRQQGGTPISDD